MSRRVVPVSVLGLVFAAVFLCPLPRARAQPDDATRAKARRSARNTLRRGSERERAELLGGLTASDDPHGAYLIALEGVAAAHERLVKSAKTRAKQGAKMFAFYAKWVVRWELPRERYTKYRGYEIENGKICEQVQALHDELGRFQVVARAVGPRVPGDEASTIAVAAEIRKLVGKARVPEARAALIAGIRGPVTRALREDLHNWALELTNRPVSTVSLSALTAEPELVDVERLAPLAQREDPVVRRFTYRLLGRVGSRAAMDVLVTGLESETGVPAHEIVSELRRRSGQRFGQDARLWREWWDAARERWTEAAMPTSNEASAFEKLEVSRYFGMVLHSTRVLFVLDRSLSMDESITFVAGARRTAADLRAPRKMQVAKRELLSALDSFDERASFNILVYGTRLDTLSPRPISATTKNLAKARRWIEKLDTEGNTNLAGALLEAMENTRPGNPLRDTAIADTLVVLSDGEPNCGPIGDAGDLLHEIRRLNANDMVAVHTVFLGVNGDADVMRRLAESNGGKFVHHKK